MQGIQGTDALKYQNLPGVPVGTKLVGIRRVMKGEYWIDSLGSLRQRESNAPSLGVLPIVEPDNVYGVIDLNTVSIPEGYERDGTSPEEWFRKVQSGHWFIADDLKVLHALVSSYGRRIILRKKKKTKRVLVAEFELGTFDSEVISNPSVWMNMIGL